MADILTIAQWYLKLGWSLLPILPETKKPPISWLEFQEHQPTIEQVKEWLDKGWYLAVVTGDISGILVVDDDRIKHGLTEWGFTSSVCSKSENNGRHYYFLYDRELHSHSNEEIRVDLKAWHSYVLLPPFNGREWINEPSLDNLAELTPLSDDIVRLINSNTKTENGESKPVVLSDFVAIGEGARTDSLHRIACSLFSKFPEDTALQILVGINQTYSPPLNKQEFEYQVSRAKDFILGKKSFESITDREMKRQKEESEKDQPVVLQLVEEIKKENILFFHNEQKEGFAAIKGDGREIYKIRSRAFKQYIAYYIYKQTGKITSSDVISNILQVLEGQALFDGQCHELAVRAVAQNNAVWYDLGNGRTVHIDKDGWTISEVPPILFRRYSHQLTQVEPKHGGDLKKLLGFINLKHEEEKLLFLVFTVAAFIPGFPHPILVLYGPQGSGKTTPQRLLKSLIDPSAIKTLSVPDGMREFVQFAAHHYFIFFDNLSTLPGWLSDSLAKAVTGDGFSKRELFSDDDDVIYSFQRTIALNGIDLVIRRADLLERSILIGLERISKEERREEQEFWQKFEEEKPKLLGAIFEAVAGAIREYPAIQLTSRPRMADFARWGCAIAKTIGYSSDQFLTAYFHNIAKQNTEAIEASSVAIAVMAFMDQRNDWEGIATELYKELEKIVVNLRIDIKSRDWPKDPSALSRKIHMVQTNLAEEGILITKDDKVRPKKFIIQKVTQKPDNGDIPSKNRENEVKSDVSTIESSIVNPDTNADNKIQSQNDGMTGLSGLLPENNQDNLGSYASTSAQPCYACGSRRFWKTKFGNIVCAACHPPNSEADVVEWLGEIDEWKERE